MRRVAIDVFIKECSTGILLDVRSPAEYHHAHIPGAISFPLFTDEERKVVGTAYKQQSREAAIKIGLDYFGPKMRGMIENIERMNKEQINEEGKDSVGNLQLAVGSKETNNQLPIDFFSGESTTESSEQTFAKDSIANRQLPTANSVFLYCWRGGMRSGAVSWLLNLYGFNVTVLAGGYKAFRNYVLQSFEQSYPFKILGGYTGSGKTEVLARLKQQGNAVIDLEGLASHKGSAFGNINMPPQPSQEMFENRLSTTLRKMNSDESILNGEPQTTSNPKPQTQNCIWLEDESQRIGLINLPGAFWKTVRKAPVYFLEIPFEERLQHIFQEYGQCGKEELSNAIERIRKRLGPMETKTALAHLTENNITECFRILLKYYDKQYSKALYNRDKAAIVTWLKAQTVTPQNASLVS